MHYDLDFAAPAGLLAQACLVGAATTLGLSALATVFGFVVGTLCAIARADGPPWLRTLAALYVETIRNTPLLVQIFLVYFGFASLGLKVTANSPPRSPRWSSMSAPIPRDRTRRPRVDP